MHANKSFRFETSAVDMQYIAVGQSVGFVSSENNKTHTTVHTGTGCS